MAFPNLASTIIRAANLRHLSGFATLIVALVASIIMHELGHLCAALMLRCEVLGVSFGPWRISFVNRRWKARFAGGSWFTASVSAIPRETASWRMNMLLVISAGPFATAACCALATALICYWNPGGRIGSLLAFLAELNTVLFLLGLLPNSAQTRTPNDARLFVSLFSRTKEAHCILLYQLLIQMKREGFRPCYYRQDFIRELPDAQCRPEMATVFAQAISDWAYDRGDFLSADAWDRRAVEVAVLCDEAYYSAAIARSACLDLMMRHDQGAAAAKCQDVQFDTLEPEWLRHRTLAVSYLANGHIIDAMCELQRAEFLLTGSLPSLEFEREILQRVRQRAKIMSTWETPLPPTEAGLRRSR
jgi:hypothetical protein